jgi:LuxR family maltose regulon positive regulatory protein
LLLAAARICVFRSQYEKLPPLLEAAVRQTEQLDAIGAIEDARVYRADAEGLWAAYSFIRGDPRSCLEHAERALVDLPSTYSALRGGAELRRAQALYALGNVTGAVQRLNDARRTAAAIDPAYEFGLLVSLKNIFGASGELPDLERTSRELVSLATASELTSASAHGHVGLAFVYYAWNELALAREHCLAVLAQRDQAYYRTVEQATFLLACAEQALGHPVTARQALQDLLDSPACATDVEHIAVARAAQARLAIIQEDTSTVTQWLHRTKAPNLTRLAHEFESPAITHARALLYAGESGAAEQALSDLETLAAACETRHDVPHLIEVLTLQALAYQSRANASQAQAELARALGLAEPGGFVRVFLDCGRPMRDLLQDRTGHHAASGLADRIRAAFGDDRQPSQAVSADGKLRDDLVEPLTRRELQILERIAAHLTNKEIAAELYISWHTVSKHVANLTQKLGVNGRRAAVARCRALGLI